MFRFPVRLMAMLLTSLVVVTTISMPALAAPGGSSAAAGACAKDGYGNWIDADGNAFRNAGECIRYAASGEDLVHIDCGGDGYRTVTDHDGNSFLNPAECSGYVLGGGTLLEDIPVDPSVPSVTLTWIFDSYDSTNNETHCEAKIELRDFPEGTYAIYMNGSEVPYTSDTITVGLSGTATYYSIGEDGVGWFLFKEYSEGSTYYVTVNDASSEWTTVDCLPEAG